MIKKIFKYLGIVVCLFFLLSIFLPSDLEVKKQRLFRHMKVQDIFYVVRDFDTWTEWDPWSTLDSNIEVKIEDVKRTWRSSDVRVGSGEMWFTSIKELESLDYEIHFDKQGKAKGKWVFIPKREGTLVVWEFSFPIGWNPISRWYVYLFMQNTIERSFENGLEQLEYFIDNSSDKK